MSVGFGCGCSSRRSQFGSGPLSPNGQGLPNIVQHEVEHKPRIVALVREGDPAAALVLAVGQLPTADAVVQLAALMSTRLATLPQPVEIRPHVGGLTLSVTLDSAAEARSLVSRFDEVWRGVVVRGEVNKALFHKHLLSWQAEVSRILPNPVRVACLNDASTEYATDPSVEPTRQRAFSELHASWGVVGSAAVVEEVRKSVQNLAPWPGIKQQARKWPDRDSASFVAGREHSARIEIAWRVPFARQAIAASQEFQASTSVLADALATLPSPWRIERVNATPLSSGGCLAVSLTPAEQSIGTTVDETIQAASIVTHELRLFSRRQEHADGVARAIAEQTDPRRAAELAAMFALSSDAETAADRLQLELDNGSEHSGSSLSAEQSEALASAATVTRPSLPISLVHTTEHGQGVLNALVASSCAAWGESSQNVGATAMMLRALATRHRDDAAVRIVPWISANGLGLVGQARRLSLDESPEQQAVRLGDALGKTLALTELDATDVWRTRGELLTRLGPSPRSALWRALTSLSPKYPGLVLPEGTFSSLASLSLLELRERRAQLLRTPMRLAVIQTEGDAQGEAVRQSLSRWLSLRASQPIKCQAIENLDPVGSEEVRLETRQSDPDDASVTLVLPLPTVKPTDAIHAELLLRLLNQPSGWLVRRLRESNVVATVGAQIVGGTRRRGLVVAVGAAPSSTDAAVVAVRALFRDLGMAAVPGPFDYSTAARELKRSMVLQRLDPRVRIEDLWLSSGPSNIGDEASFLDYLRRAFATSNLSVVRAQRSASEMVPSGRNRR